MPEQSAPPQAAPEPRPRRRRRLPRWLWLIPVAIIASALIWRSRQPASVEVVHPQQRMVAQTLTASGRVEGAREVELSVEQAGVLVAVLVSEGDQVAIGQVVARTSADTQSAELARAEATIATARAQLSEARASARVLPASIEQAEAEVRGAVEQARERLAAGEARLAELQAGGRAEERREASAAVEQAAARVAQAEREVERARDLAEADATARAPLERAQAATEDAAARVQQAQTQLEQAERDLSRAQRLFAEGVVSEASYEAARTSAETARRALEQTQAQRRQAEVEVENQRTRLEVTREAELERAQTELRSAGQALEQARARLELVSGPARAEQIEQAQAEVRSARAALRAAETAGPARVETVRRTPVSERVLVAERQLAEAMAARDTVLTRLEATEVVARFPGVVTAVVREVGDVVAPGQAIVRLSEMDWPEVHLEIDERDIALVQVGQAAQFTADAYPEDEVAAQVVRIGAEAETERGIVNVVLRPDTRPPWLRSGMTVDASIVVAPGQSLLVLPTPAVVQSGQETWVLAVEDGEVRRREVQTAVGGVGGTVVLSGVDEEALVVRSPAQVRAGERVRPVLVEGAEAMGNGL